MSAPHPALRGVQAAAPSGRSEETTPTLKAPPTDHAHSEAPPRASLKAPRPHVSLCRWSGDESPFSRAPSFRPRGSHACPGLEGEGAVRPLAPRPRPSYQKRIGRPGPALPGASFQVPPGLRGHRLGKRGGGCPGRPQKAAGGRILRDNQAFGLSPATRPPSSLPAAGLLTV